MFNPNAPRIVTFTELTNSLSKFLDRRSAKQDLHDLWKMGAPIPGNVERRILLPTQFAAWWKIHVADRHAQNPNYTMYAGKYQSRY